MMGLGWERVGQDPKQSLGPSWGIQGKKVVVCSRLEWDFPGLIPLLLQVQGCPGAMYQRSVPTGLAGGFPFPVCFFSLSLGAAVYDWMAP